jgi:hypothetical protein
MNVHQLSISYVPEQDRILVRINTMEGAELHFWLTRRLALGLVPVLDKVATEHGARQGVAGVAPAQVAAMDPMAKKAVAEFQRSETLRSADFSTPYQPAKEAPPLFEQPLLLTEVNITPLANGQLRIACAEKLPPARPGMEAAPPRAFQLGLSQQLVHAFMHLLERAMQQSQWRDATGATVRAAVQRDPTPGADGNKPTWLN